MQLAVACEPLLFLPYFDVIFDLLLSRHMALWNRFVISNINIWLISGHRDPFEVLWHSTSFYCHVCAQNRFPFHCLRVWKSVSTESFQCNLYEYQRHCELTFYFTSFFCFLWFKTFLLFPSSESSNQCHSVCFPYFSYLYQIAHLGDDDDEPEFSSAMELEEGTTFFFSPRGLKNLVLVDELESLAPVMSCQV